MTSWVISIAKKYFKDHWKYAQRDLLWDMPRHYPVTAGDIVYFRQSDGPLLGQGKVEEGARPLRGEDLVPWNDGREPYRERFTFNLLSRHVAKSSLWADVAATLEAKPRRLQIVQAFTTHADQSALSDFFLTPFEAMLEDALADDGDESPPLDRDELAKDQRDIVERLEARREGRERFRSDLIAAYGQCAITGTKIEAVIDGAHIMPYLGRQTNVIRNGLPLRGDIHRLFDDHLLTIDTQGIVRVAPSVTDAIYRDLDGRPMKLPTPRRLRPDKGVLKDHNADCKWLSA